MPTVGGHVHAYAPCNAEYMVMQAAWDYYISWGGYWAYNEYLYAAWDYSSCMSGYG